MLMIMRPEHFKKGKTGAEISTNELRLEFDRVLKALKQGRSLTLTYRNKPLARIVPIEEERVLREDDPIYHMYEMAEAIGSPLTNMDIDQLVYGR
jgi:prevent-host-death family protein